jgi:hypothetical protein
MKKNIYFTTSILIIVIGVFISLILVFYFFQENNVNQVQINKEDVVIYNPRLSSIELANNNPYRGPEIKIDPMNVVERARAKNDLSDVKNLDEIEKALFNRYFAIDYKDDSGMSEIVYFKIRPVNIEYILENKEGKKFLIVNTYNYYHPSSNFVKQFGDYNSTYYNPSGAVDIIVSDSKGNYEYVKSTQQAISCQELVSLGFEPAPGCFDETKNDYFGGISQMVRPTVNKFMQYLEANEK